MWGGAGQRSVSVHLTLVPVRTGIDFMVASWIRWLDFLAWTHGVDQAFESRCSGSIEEDWHLICRLGVARTTNMLVFRSS